MPAMLEDVGASVIRRESPSAVSQSNRGAISRRKVILRDRVTAATLIPFTSPQEVPPALLQYLCVLFNTEIEKGDTYPLTDTLSVEQFGNYWFANFGAVMLLGDVESDIELSLQGDWSKACLGGFYIKPNYPGRSSHICNGGFLVGDAARNKGVGRLMGEGYLDWAPKLGYTYSVFNLVYETNVASCRIWDSLGFKRIGRIKGAGNLKSYPDELIDAIIYGRDLGPEGEDYVSEERFDKIRYYLKNQTYPAGADRAEKSRLRSAATHYRLEADEKLMLKDKEVISDPQHQYEIARSLHVQSQPHGGINKTTAAIAERYHWVRIKDSVSLVIKNCPECRDPSRIRSDPQAVKRSPEPNGRLPGRATPVNAASTTTAPMQTHARGALSPEDEQLMHAMNEQNAQANAISYQSMQYDPHSLGIPLDPRIMGETLAGPTPYQQHPPTVSRNVR